jgi:hypothetical protein
LEKRIVRLENDLWRIRTDSGEIPDSEQKELEEYLTEIKLPYRVVDGHLCLEGGVDREAVFDRLEHFYDGRADVFPF